jgi:adenylate kinase family enzyme
MRIAIVGNSGSGKSTLARWLAKRTGAALLDLDSVAWVPGQIAVPKSEENAESEVRFFCSGHEHWVLEGCYANLIHAALPFSPRLLFLNPGEEQCIANCRARPWEPHKYRSKDEQDMRLPFLLSWVGEYYRRGGEMSLAGHLACFENYVGPKRELRTVPVLTPPSPEVLTWID